jgi:hypothetical protein
MNYLEWLIRVAEDAELHPLSYRLAMKIAALHLNNTSEGAWPSLTQLGNELQVDLRTVMRAMAQLVQRQHLACEHPDPDIKLGFQRLALSPWAQGMENRQ